MSYNPNYIIIRCICMELVRLDCYFYNTLGAANACGFISLEEYEKMLSEIRAYQKEMRKNE